MNLVKPKRERDADYIEWIKTQTCLALMRGRTYSLSEYLCDGPIDPHHVIPDGGGKVGSKVDDRRCVPLCRNHHDMAGRREWFQRTFNIDFESDISQFNAEYDRTHPKRERKERKRTPRAKILIEGCICGQKHILKFGKTYDRQDTIELRCPIRNVEVQAVK